MTLTEKIAWVNGILLAISETLPLIKTNITEATSLLTFIFSSLRKLKEGHILQTLSQDQSEKTPQDSSPPPSSIP